MTRWFLPDSLPTVFFQNFGLIGAVEEFAFEELHSDYSEDEHEEDVDNEDVQDVLQGVHNTVKHCLEYKYIYIYIYELLTGDWRKSLTELKCNPCVVTTASGQGSGGPARVFGFQNKAIK